MQSIIAGKFGEYCISCARQASVKYFIKGNTACILNRPHGTICLQRYVCQVAKRTPQPMIVVPYRTITNLTSRGIYSPIPRVLQYRNPVYIQPSRPIVTRIIGAASRLLKLRYLVFGSAVGGGITLSQTVESWKEKIPDFSWMKEYLPESEQLDKFSQNVKDLASQVRAALPEIPTLPEMPAMPEKGWLRKQLPSMDSLKEWLDETSDGDLASVLQEDAGVTMSSAVPMVGNLGMSKSETENPVTDKPRLEQIQEEMMHVQIRYQKEIDRLEKDIKELKKQLLLKEQKSGRKRSMKKSLIDMYSDVLDELADYDSSYNTQDHLPRVVVVGDQSSGKTSVLEMVAQARIFPRGSGEMMTRSPVKVTLSEGPYHIAMFKDSNREFDLTKEADLAALRNEVEVRMKGSLKDGQTVSSECISMTVKGPGLQRMVLVDLPGIISTQTAYMAPDTRESIRKMCRSYMENPNAIILCIQDGSIDAERSNVTDIVNSMDPSGRRTIFVLTKVDLAESNLYNPDRIKQTLEGKLFPMKALGYFAVVTGKGNTNDSIQTIKAYEESFFRKSRLFKDGVLKPTQMTTPNLSMAVSELFWKMVKESVEQQTDNFKATRFNLETEWKNTYPNVRELDRDELFERARGEILDEIINLSQVSHKKWEESFSRRLWEQMSPYVFEKVYIPASQADDAGTFNTTVDIKLQHWADKMLANKSVEIGWKTLLEEYEKIVEGNKKLKGHDEIFDDLKTAVKDGSMLKHNWDNKAVDSLRVIQMNVVEDRSVPDKQHWDTALKFMEDTVKDKLEKSDALLKEMTGPTTREQWVFWRSLTVEHKNRKSVKSELEKLLSAEQNHKSALVSDEITTVRRNLQTSGVEVDDAFIRETWHQVYLNHFLVNSLRTSQECKKGFYYYQRGFTDTGMECNDVVLFWRLHRIVQVTANALRQQVVNNETRRLERNIREVLDELSEDQKTMARLLTGKRVLLAEELKRVRTIQDKLEEFVQSLNKEQQDYR